jgi:hypothetical protein
MTSQIDSALETFTFPSKVDQAAIFARKWLPPSGIRPRATVQITHCIAEHSGRYAMSRACASLGRITPKPETCLPGKKRTG